MTRWTFLTLFLLCMASRAMAIQPYNDESCAIVLKNQRPSSIKFYSDTSQHAIVVQGKDDNFDLDAQYVDKRENPGARKNQRSSDLVVKITSESNRTKSKYNDGCLRGETGDFTRDVKISYASVRTVETLGLKEGQSLRLKCQWESLQVLPECSNN